ncbi:MAG: enoyl-CoA hydratase/isomerase family protein, partial [Chloroflexota bacterium]|nr:enoyl-CoA hydratase/isomerase family protein [Chloroflexota bacterium]
MLVERRDRVGLLILNRPTKLNAMTTEMMLSLEDALSAFDEDEGIGAVVITGAGERAFSSGRDLGEETGEASLAPGQRRPRGPASFGACRKPTIAAIRGFCYGGGALLALGCDIRIAAEDARFKFPGASYGLAAGAAQLPAIVGSAMAKELLFTADVIDAAEALRIGLVNHVVAAAELFDYALAMAARIAANSPEALIGMKEIVDLALPAHQAAERQAAINRELRGTHETSA